MITETSTDSTPRIAVTELDGLHQDYEPASVWAKNADDLYAKALTLLVNVCRDSSPQESAVIQALLSQDDAGGWTGLLSDDRVDFEGPITSENITRCLHMHAHTTFPRRDVIASYLVVESLMDMGLTAHIHSDWAKLLVEQLLLESIATVKEREESLSPDDTATVNRIHAWTKAPLQFNAWVAKAAEVLLRDPSAVLPRRTLLRILNRRDLRPRPSAFRANYTGDVLGYLTRLVCIG